MSRSTMHTALGAVACALTLAVFLAFSGSLPESVPMQFSLTGEVSTYWPRDAVVFGVPAAFTAVEVAVGISLSRKDDAKAWRYWIVPVVAFAATGIILLMGTR